MTNSGFILLCNGGTVSGTISGNPGIEGCTAPIAATVNVKSLDSTSTINVKNANGITTVYLMGSDTVNVPSVNNIKLGLVGYGSTVSIISQKVSISDVNSDGYVDLVLQYKTSELNSALSLGANLGVQTIYLTGDMGDNHIQGSGQVRIISK